MKDFPATLSQFINELSHFTGAVPTVKIDFKKKEITLVEAPSGFIKQLCADSRWVLSLGTEGISLSRFED